MNLVKVTNNGRLQLIPTIKLSTLKTRKPIRGQKFTHIKNKKREAYRIYG